MHLLTFSQVWETPLLPRQVLDKLEIKGFKVSKFVRFVKTTYSDAAMVEMGQKSNLCSVRLMIFLSTSLCRIDQILSGVADNWDWSNFCGHPSQTSGGECLIA